MADVGAQISGNAVKTAIKELAKEKAAREIDRLMPNDDGKAKKLATTLVSTAIDGLSDMSAKGGVESKTLYIAAFRGVAATLPVLSDDQKAACVGALLALAADGRAAGGHLALVAGEEFATGGLATPIVAMQAALLVKSAVDVVNATVKAHQQCGPLAVDRYESIKTDWSQFAGGLEAAITNRILSRTLPLY
jgi:hypothetical protein